MRFAIGEAVVDVIVDDDDFELPLGTFCLVWMQGSWPGTAPCSSRRSSTSRRTG